MRVIAGTARGTKLKTLPGEEVTRPTTDRVKEAMFSSIQFQVPGARVLDLFAGSGQLGIEALSRGAAHCTFIDQSQDAAAVVIQNCKAAGVFKNSRVSVGEASRFLAGAQPQFHIVFLDPPYHNDTVQRILPQVARVTLPGGTVIAETELACVLPEECGGLVLKKQHHYGKILVTRYEKGEEE